MEGIEHIRVAELPGAKREDLPHIDAGLDLCREVMTCN